MVELLQKKDILPASLAGPSLVCVDVVARRTIYLNDLYAQLMDQFVVQVLKRIIGGKSVRHQSLAKGNNAQVLVTKGILRHLWKNQVQRNIFIALKLMMKLKTTLMYHFQISCIFIPSPSTSS